MSSKYAIPKKDDFILSEESATEQVIKLLSYYDFDIELIEDSKIKKNFENALDAIGRFIRKGVLEITEDKDGKLNVVHNLTAGGSITYGELCAKNKLAMDRVSTDETYRRLYALMGSMSGLGSSAIEKLPAKDLAAVEVLATLFSNA